jgi:hypothetical protein
LRRRRFIRILVPAAAAASLFLPSACNRRPKPSHQEVIARLEAGQSSYDRIVSMLREDPWVGTIAPDYLFEAGKPWLEARVDQLGITPERLAEYRRLLAAAGALQVDRIEKRVMFMHWKTGSGKRARHKGLMWNEEASPEIPEARYSKIRGNWYVFED